MYARCMQSVGQEESVITKKTSPKGRSVRITFELPAGIAEQRVSVVGDFNDWDPERHPMKLDPKRGVWTTAISFKPGTVHEFRYFIDGDRWANEDEADRVTPTPYFSENSVLEV